MKKFHPVLLFFFGSLLILGIFTFFYWNYYQNNPDNIEHLRLKNWSEPVKIAANVPSSSSAVLFGEDGFDFFSIQEEREKRERVIIQTRLDYTGEVQETSEFARAGHLGFPVIASYGGEEYLCYFAGDSSQAQSLFVNKIDGETEPVSLKDNISFSSSLSYIESEDMLVLAFLEWDRSLGGEVISVIGFNPLNQEETLNYTFPFEVGVRYPKIAKVDDKIFMNWHERNPETMFISGQEARHNSYFFKVGEMYLEEGELGNGEILGEAYGNSTANSDSVQLEEQILLSWVQYDQEAERELINIGSFNADGDYEQLDRSIGFNPALAASEKGMDLVYSRREGAASALYLDEFSEAEADSRNQRMFPALSTSRRPHLKRHEQERFLFWSEIVDRGRDIYYSNTAAVEDITASELMGFSTIESSIQLLSSMIMYFSYPVLGFIVGMINFIIPIFLVIATLYLLGKKYTWIKDLRNDSAYFSFLSNVLAILFFNQIVQGDLNYLFVLSSPPVGHDFIVLGLVTLITLGFIYFLSYDRLHSVFIGMGCVFLWFYWLIQAASVYEFYQFFI